MFPKGVTVILTTGIEDRGAVFDDKKGDVATLGGEVCMTASTLRRPRGGENIVDAAVLTLLEFPCLLFLSEK